MGLPVILDADIGGEPDDAMALVIAARELPELTLVLTSDLDTPRDADRPHARLRIVPMIGPGTYGLSFGGSL